MTIGQVIMMYVLELQRLAKKSQATTFSHSARLRTLHGTVELDSINHDWVVGYQRERQMAGAANATINREVEILSQALRLAERKGVSVPKLYVARLPENNVRQGFFEHEDWDRLAKHLPWWLVGFCDFAYYTGWRKSEIAGLRWSDITFVDNAVDAKVKISSTIRLRDSKNGEARVIPLAGPLRAVVQAALYNRIDSCPWVFHDPEGNKIRDFRKRWLTACRAAGFAVAPLFHDFRRTAVRNMIERGVDREVAKKITGHKTDSMFARYQIVDQRQMTAALEKL